ncbi:MAG: hypothetical protein DCF27_01300 [Lysobacteraceae bacterium]|nr:MAG: hypothetical protein DCF27_01300 [Xanthomonadaceae bacterium]
MASGVLVLLASCSPQPVDDLEVILPDVSLLRPYPGCKVESVSPAVALPRELDGNGAYYGSRHAIIRFEAVCLPNLSDPSPWWQPYRISFEQSFRMQPDRAGVAGDWLVVDAQPVVDPDQPSRAVSGATEARGNNCAALLDRIESGLLPCLRAKSPALAALVQKDFQNFREDRFTFNVRGDNELNFRRLSRDKDCLSRWRQLQHAPGTALGMALNSCAVD